MAQDTTGWCENLQSGYEPLSVDAAPSAAVGAVPFVLDGVLMVPKGSADSGSPVSCEMRGVWRMPKVAPLVIAGGDPVYWNASSKYVTKTVTDVLIGFCKPGTDAASADTTVDVVIDPCVVTAKAAAVAVDTTALLEHTGDTSGAHAASAISVTAGNSVTATDVEAAILELDTNIDNHIADTSAAHNGTAIEYTPAGSLAATTVSGAINELDADLTAARGLYAVTFAGANTTGGAAAAALTVKTAGVTPAVGDIVVSIFGWKPVDAELMAFPVVGTDFTATLVSSTGTKIEQKQAAGDLSAYTTMMAWIMPKRSN